VIFSPDGKTLAYGSNDGMIYLWDLNRSCSSGVLKAHQGMIRSLSFSPDGRILASGSDDGSAGLWSISTGKLLSMQQGHLGTASALAFSPDGKTLVTAPWSEAGWDPDYPENSVAMWSLEQ
jgi:WD40 repeat protein